MTLPDFKYEKQFLKMGEGETQLVAGADEVGRGCFAGPVVAACVVFPLDVKGTSLTISRTIRVDDSKRMSVRQREKASIWIKKNALACGIGLASVFLINKFGIKKASEIAFRKAINRANLILKYEDKKILGVQKTNNKVKNYKPISHNRNIDFLLVDAFLVPRVRGLAKKNQLAIVKGDQKSFSIAAASIIAKVKRDSLIERIGLKKQYINYGWHSNKGYGTKYHREAIVRYGISKLHRTQFVETFLKKCSK